MLTVERGRELDPLLVAAIFEVDDLHISPHLNAETGGATAAHKGVLVPSIAGDKLKLREIADAIQAELNPGPSLILGLAPPGGPISTIYEIALLKANPQFEDRCSAGGALKLEDGAGGDRLGVTESSGECEKEGKELKREHVTSAETCSL